MIVRHGPAAAVDGLVFPYTVRVLAPAKVNLFLEVLGKRPDGFHEIATLMLAIDLADVLDFGPGSGPGLSLTCDDSALSTGPENLVLKAANRLRLETGCTLGATIHLWKRIPMAAGLGGGSSDAGAALEGLNKLWKLGLSQAELARIGSEIGSDVPFFLNGPAAWCTGRGEVVTPVAMGRPIDLVLVKPPEGLATADVYRHLRVPVNPVAGEAVQAALVSGDVEALGQAIHNRLQETAFEISPKVADWHRRLSAFGTAGVLMSGSGSCVFALCRSPSEAQQVHDDLSNGLASEGLLSTRVFRVRSWL